ncbi:hypothetical protein ACQKOD_06040 [Bacillus mycoides]|uniref:hypothetical protein n=1 Tax=Bacillus mycoides TaxID=1405 RepID=UPI003D011705
MFLGFIEIPKHETRYLDLPEEKRRELAKKKRRRRKKTDSDEEKPLKREKLHSQTKKDRKEAIKIEFNGGESLHNWDYEANNYKN